MGPRCVPSTGDLVTNWHLFSIFEPGRESLATQQGEEHQDSEWSVFSAESTSASMMSAERRQSGGQKPWTLASLRHQFSHQQSEGAGLGQALLVGHHGSRILSLSLANPAVAEPSAVAQRPTGARGAHMWGACCQFRVDPRPGLVMGGL